MNRWKVILAALVIFATGAATGGVLVRVYAPKVVKRTQVIPPGSSPERRQEYLSKLDRELSLTPEQRVEIEKILVESQDRMKEIWEPFGQQARDEYRKTRKSISELLSEEQREKMWNLRKEKDKDGQRKGGGSEKNDRDGRESSREKRHGCNELQWPLENRRCV